MILLSNILKNLTNKDKPLLNRTTITSLSKTGFDSQFGDAITAKSLGFMARNLIQATLPHSTISNQQFSRKNGKYTLSIMSDKEIGVPYGIYPRLILCWLTILKLK